MGADNYENLGFQVKIDGATDAVKHLDDIIDRLERIQKLKNVSGNGRLKSKKNGVATDKQIFQEDVETARQKGHRNAYKNLLNLISKEEQLNYVYAEQTETYKQLLSLKEKMFSYNVSAKNDVQNLTVANETVKAQVKAQQLAKNLRDEGYVKAQQELAVENERLKLLKKQAVEEERRKQKPTQTEAEKYLQRVNAERDLLNSKIYEEARRTDIANKQRKKEIDQRLKQELGIKKTTNALTSYIGKLTSTVVIARKFAHVISSAIQESANYVENLNLFAVAYGDVYQESLDWALNLADGFGLASNEILKFAGTFRQLSTSLGLVENTANSVSKTVTQLGYDMSALFNTSVENAMEKLQSSLFSGNVRPLRAYGIDISQNQIDALFETNEALASLGANARNLSQSDKVLARLIITLRDGSNAFGTMNREINTLQSQIRILQGSFSNFKLAIGDLVYEPVRDALIVINALTMAITNIVRRIKPLQKEDKNTVFNGVAMGAEEANEEIDELNGKLASFDKFNVLGGQSQDTTSSAVTDALTSELAKQQEYYAQQVALMDDTKNKAKELSKVVEPLLIAFGALFTIFTAKTIGKDSLALLLLSKESGMSIQKTAKELGGLSKATTVLARAFKFLTSPLGITLSVIGVLYAANEDFRNSINNLIKTVLTLVGTALSPFLIVLETTFKILGAIINVTGKLLSWIVTAASWIIEIAEKTGLLEAATWGIIAALTVWASIKLGNWLYETSRNVVAFIQLLPEYAKSIYNSVIPAMKKFVSWLQTSKSAAQGLALLGIGMLIVNVKQLIENWGNLTAFEKVIGIFGAIGAAALAAAAAIAAFQGAWTLGTAAVAIVGALVAIAGAFATFKKDTQVDGFADGGYTNANMIMTHENGKREWVGKAAGSSAIVNDTQMSDIMEVAVAKGVYQALSARNQMGGNTPTNETIVVKIGEEAVFNAVRKTARRQGRDFANV